ncbi:uracil-DNA glycosylase [Haloferacaceae archaeon DSL9]
MAASDAFESVFAAALAAVPDDQFDRERFVPSAGPLDASVMLIGEAPGGDEVAQGAPFVGQAGKQLDRILADIDIDREELYITNLVKVRPPENRNPHRAEIDAWWPVLRAEIDRVDPAVLVPLGSFATKELLDTDEGVTALRGREFEVRGRRVVPTFHPAATFYDRSKRETIEADLREIFASIS